MNEKNIFTAPLNNRLGKYVSPLLLSLMLCMLFTVRLYAQMPPINFNVPIEMKPSPEAGGLGRYGDIPVSYYTGIPDISIPLFEITHDDITLPIKLSYHASGFKVNDVASWAGLGWTLVAGGVITRKVNRLPDNDYQNIPTVKEVIEKKDYDFLHMQANSRLQLGKDCQPDEFTYSFMGYQGKFVWDEGKRAYQNPHNNLIIRYDYNTFTIHTSDGYKYIFKDIEYGFFNSPMVDGGEGSYIEYSAITSWFMSAIVSPAQDTICRFKYEQQNDMLEYADDQYYSMFGKTANCWNEKVKYIYKTVRSETTRLIRPCYLKEITFNMGKIVFETSAGRKDRNKNGLILDAMKVYAGGELKKWIEFKHDYFFSDKGFK